MIILRFPGRSNPEVSLFLAVISLALVGAAVLAFKLTKGHVISYFKKDIPEWLKGTMLIIQGPASVLFAMIVPNNYLADIEFFLQLYKQNGLWIGFSMIVLLFTSVLGTGLLFSFITRNRATKNDPL
jgi:hypothetical protein